MTKNRLPKLKKEVPSNEKPKKQGIEVIQGNVPTVTLQLLDTINNNIVALLAYLKHRDIENKRR